nr:H-NS family nucleoid-associated regulatory protein [Paraburkholderia aspalathi]
MKTKTAPKYRHPARDATWTRHGRAPGWIAPARGCTQFLLVVALIRRSPCVRIELGA